MTQVTLNSGAVSSAGTLKLQSNGTTDAIHIDASQNVGIGTSSPSARLEVYDTSAAAATSLMQFTGQNNYEFNIQSVTTGNSTVGARFNFAVNASNGEFSWSNSGGERARIDSSGNLLVGTTETSKTSGVGLKLNPNSAGSAQFSCVGAASSNANESYHLYSTGAGAYRFYVGYGGTVYATSTSISSLSDIRFKENVRDLDAGLAEVLSLKSRLYDWKEGKGADIKNARGFIAQEFETVFPDLIDEWKGEAPEGEDPYKSVRQDLIPVLVKAIQEQQAMINAQQAALVDLQAAVAELKAK